MANLEIALRDYLRDPSSTPFDITTVPVDVPEPVKPAKETAPGTRDRTAPGPAATPASTSAEGGEYSQILSQVRLFTIHRLSASNTYLQFTILDPPIRQLWQIIQIVAARRAQ
jgi:hypothetical protein